MNLLPSYFLDSNVSLFPETAHSVAEKNFINLNPLTPGSKKNDSL